MATFTGSSHIKGSTETVRMVLLTFAAIGISFTWGIEMTYFTPYLLNLGLTKSNTALVWIAGPLSGLITQPVIGSIADQYKSKWGRRRPFIFMGSIVVTISFLVVGFTKEITDHFATDEETSQTLAIVLAVLAIYVADFAINADEGPAAVTYQISLVMSCSRSLVVDTLPIEKQQAGAAWSSRMAAVGNMLAYGAGAVNLVGIFGEWLGDTQFKQITLIASFFNVFSACITCWAVTERVLVSTKGDQGHRGGPFKFISQIYSTIRTLPPRIRAICWAQFWAWLGWFPLLFYSTTWVGETYFRYDVPADALDSHDVLGDIGRIGSTSLTIFSIITFLASWLLPLVVQSPEDGSFTPRPAPHVASLVKTLGKRKPDLLTAWVCGHLLFAVAMMCAPLAKSLRFATFLVALCGLPWALATWAPVTFLGVEVSRLSGASSGDGALYRRVSYPSRGPSVELPALGQAQALDLENARDDDDHDHDDNDDDDDGTDDARGLGSSSSGELSGIYFGILNIFSTIPQFIGTFVGAIIFSILEPGKSPELTEDGISAEELHKDGPNAIAVCLFLGGLCAIGAAYMTRRLKYIP
ncbi:sucrose transporter [Sodiomyces alkalinus F11]|uniref:Sucrose transporter n=1 Tax=Sodiomyces alkalinus (strain CBS 110278 / VKM F-3762 / F11) TaxID=1314773 RepID=A0A3N2PQZ1_SODAK|nr:sucrose transporter [Sodiomyces alkalinus F11]ROT36931.1 sucrose transporter [Sodiomyces alkalinus F11]